MDAGRTSRLAVALPALAAALSILGACSGAESTPPRPLPEASESVPSLPDLIAATRTMALLVVRDGEPLLEWYAPPGGPQRLYRVASLSKALVGGMATMVAMDDGRLDLDEPVAPLVPGWEDDPRKRAVTARQLASHCSGMAPGARHGTDREAWEIAFWSRGADLFPLVLSDAPVTFPPGKRYLYSGPGYAVLGYAVTASLPRGDSPPDIEALLRQRIMEPLGVPDREWRIGYGMGHEIDGLRLRAAWGGGSYSPHAAARVGQLMLQEGMWRGRRLLRAETVRSALTHVEACTPSDPGHPAPVVGWWSNADGALSSVPRDAYLGAGAGHEILLVVPSLRLVVVRYGLRIGDSHWGGDFWTALDSDFLRPLMAIVEEMRASSPDRASLGDR